MADGNSTAIGEARGVYRPEANGIMLTRADDFCAVCRRALSAVIDSGVT